jgi:hypothetical protein
LMHRQPANKRAASLQFVRRGLHVQHYVWSGPSLPSCVCWMRHMACTLWGCGCECVYPCGCRRMHVVSTST